MKHFRRRFLRRIVTASVAVSLLAGGSALLPVTPTPASAADTRGLRPQTGVTDLDRPFSDVTWITAHNAMNTIYNPQPVYAQQNLTVPQQLERGVRGLMLDLHWQRNIDEVAVCHVTCGEYPHTFATHVEGAMRFLGWNSEEIITLQLESHVTREQLAHSAKRFNLFSGQTFDPSYWATPGWPTLRQMIDANQRLVVFGSDEIAGTYTMGNGGRFHVVAERQTTVANHWNMGDTIGSHDRSCAPSPGGLALNAPAVSLPGKSWPRLFTMNQFHGWGTDEHASEDNSVKRLKERVEQYCMPLAGRAPNYIALDFVDRGGAFDYAKQLNQRPYTPAPVTPDPEPEPEPEEPFTVKLTSVDDTAKSITVTGTGARGATVVVSGRGSHNTRTVIPASGTWSATMSGLGGGYQQANVTHTINDTTSTSPPLWFSLTDASIDPGDPCNKPGSQFLPECDSRPL